MKTPLNLCYTAKKKKIKKKNLNRLYKTWLLALKRGQGVGLNNAEYQIFETYLNKICKELKINDI